MLTSQLQYFIKLSLYDLLMHPDQHTLAKTHNLLSFFFHLTCNLLCDFFSSHLAMQLCANSNPVLIVIMVNLIYPYQMATSEILHLGWFSVNILFVISTNR